MQYVFVSDYVRRTFGRNLNSQQVIYPGSNLAMFNHSAHLSSQVSCVGMVYRLEPDKLNACSIDPFIEVVRRFPTARMLIVGEGSLKKVFEEKVCKQGLSEFVDFAGAVPYDDLPEFFARMTLFVAPVWKESFGQVGCFAMSMGIPVVGYRVGGIEEIVGNPELLAAAGDSHQLANIIIDLLNDPQRRQAIGEFNRQRAYSLFSVESMVARYAKLYREVLGEAS
jgi:glycosyltransferase involved in cell wall biosynthesis